MSISKEAIDSILRAASYTEAEYELSDKVLQELADNSDLTFQDIQKTYSKYVIEVNESPPPVGGMG